MSGAAQDRLDRLRLIRSSHIGPVTYFQLIQRFGSATAALEAVPRLAARGGSKPPVIAPIEAVDREIETVERLGARYLFLNDPGYPGLLAEIDTAPPALIIRGDTRLLDRPTVAIVGARNASAAACRFARQLAQTLSEAGVLIVSGLARGIDTAAHQGSLAEATAAVIACGIDLAYPPENAQLQEEIATRGLLIAEQPPGREPLARHFPYRNRIIAGMSLATVVVEAAPKSGSLITARLAAEAGREVLAVPGSPLDPRAQGCNSLIREGATLIQSAADVLEAINPMAIPRIRDSETGFESEVSLEDPDPAARNRIVALLSPTPVPVDELIRQSGLAPAMVNLILLELELASRIERHAGGRVALSCLT
jgi:DNA processing protein